MIWRHVHNQKHLLAGGMSMNDDGQSNFLEKARAALEHLFESARTKNELNFALSLAPEFKAYTLTSAIDAQRAYREYGDFLQLEQFKGQGIAVRVAMALYCHTAEAAGLWGVPMCQLLVLSGENYTTSPFNYLVAKHKATGQTIAPNANKVMRALADESSAQGMDALAEVFRDAFDPDLRNGFAHADYALSTEGVHVRGRHDQARIIGWPEFHALLNDGIGLLDVLKDVIKQYEIFYQTPRIVAGTTHPEDPIGHWMIYSDPVLRTMTVSGGAGWTPEKLTEKFERESQRKA